MDDSTRRRFVRTTALVSIGALAGCGGDDDEGGGAQAPNESNETGEEDGEAETTAAGGEAETTEAPSFGDPRAESR